MQIEQRGRTDAVPAPRYKLTRAVILTVFSYRRWVAYPATPEGMLRTKTPLTSAGARVADTTKQVWLQGS